MRRIISENGMSLKLVQHCNESKIFLVEFLNLFNTFKTDDIDYIRFTGDTAVGKFNLKPDITIRYNNGEKAYIEVKTNANTCYQKSQTANQNNEDIEEEQSNYIELLKDENRVLVGEKVEKPEYIESHLGYLLDKNHYDNAIKENGKFALPKVSWNEVYDKVLQFGYIDFGRDIKENVDGIIRDNEEIKFTPYDIALLYNSRLFNEKLLILQNIEYEKIITQIRDNKLEDILEYNKGINIKDYFIEKQDGPSFAADKSGFKKELYNNSIPYIVNLITEKMYWGWEPEILERKVIYKSEGTKTEDYLYSFAIDKELLNLKKLREDKIKYLEDEYRWIYFPIKNEYLPHITSNKDPCKACNNAEQLRLDKLNICKTILCFYKMKELIEKSENKIVDKLNQCMKNSLKFICGGWDKYYPGCLYIDINDKNDSNKKPLQGVLSYGLMQNVFEDDFEKGIENDENKEIIISDYFLSVCFNINEIQKEFNITPKKLKNGVIHKTGWVYYPICRMTLCKENYLEAFTDKVVSIIKDVLDF